MLSRTVILMGLIAALFSNSPLAYETDQYSNRLLPVQDSMEVLDRQVNDTIAGIAANWKGDGDQSKFVNRIYHRLGGLLVVDKLERWAMKSRQVDRQITSRRDSIYSGLPIWSVRAVGVFGLGPTIKVNNTLMGSDKIGHFFSQGRKYYRRWLRSGDEAKAARRAAYTERALFGKFATGSYSNADLVANYEGHRFYRSLFEDNIIPGKQAILKWQDGQWLIQRPFTWADHVNQLWDEALHPNDFDALLQKHMLRRLKTFCDDYKAVPNAYTINNEADLFVRYSHLGLRDTRDMRLATICVNEDL